MSIKVIMIVIVLLQVDDRFFWNKHMIQDLIDLKVNIFKCHSLSHFSQHC